MSEGTLLVVEDNLMLRAGLQETLQNAGFTVHTATNGREGLKQVAAVQPDLIVSDIAMPEMNGFEFFTAVRGYPEWVAIPFIFLTARSERRDVLAAKDMGAEDYLIKPVVPDELIMAVKSRLTRSRQLHLAQLRQSYESSLTMLANAIEVRDYYTRGHVERVMAYSLIMARRLGWSGVRLEHLRYGAILHDIGKIHTRESTLHKPDRLTEEEWAEIRQHPVTGAEMIRDVAYLAPAVPIVRHHHERWDGKGYPDCLAGNKIPLAARIVAVGDSFDAMTTDRPYQPGMSPAEAYQEILSGAGKQYDPAVVTVFQQAWEANEIQALAK